MKKLSFIIVCFFVCISTLQSFAETRTITGQVVDEEDMAIIGATVVTSDGSGTITDLDGNFSLNISEATKTIEVSYMGYKSQTLKVGDKTVFFVRLEADVHTLQEVVAVGYGTQKKINLTGSIENVDMRTLENRALTNASMALQGQVSGVMVVQGSGQAGGDQAQIRIRGISSMENNNSPLVIIDGMEGDINDVDPKDIESMTVMKDASSAAIYGNKAASGVVLITTKRGRGDVFQVDYSFMQSLQEPTRLPEIVNAKEYITLWNEANINDGTVPRYDLDKEFAAYDEGTKASINWYDVYFKRAPMQKHHINIMLSSGNLNTSTSFSYLKQDGIIMNSDAERYGIRTNIEYKVNNWLRIGSRLNYTRRTSQEPFHLFRVFEQQTGAAPFISPYTRDGKFGSVEAIRDDGTLMYTLYQPLIDASNGATKTTSDYMSLNAFAIVDFSKDLNLQVTWASNGSWKETDKHNETIYGYTDSGIESLAKNYNRDGIVLSREQISTMRNNFQATLNYNKKFEDKSTNKK